MSTRVFFKGDRQPSEMVFKAHANVWEMLQKTLASFSPEELRLITAIHIFEAGLAKPIFVFGPFAPDA
jgi:hypothetical protein